MFGAESFDFLRSQNMVGYVANSGINKIDEHNYVLIVMCQGFKYKTY